MSTRQKIIFIGSKAIGLKIAKIIYSISKSNLIGIISFDDSEDKRSVIGEFKNFTQENNIDFFIPEVPKNLTTLINKLKPEVCFVAGWYWIIKKEVLDRVPMGFIGLHNSLLPKYRGGAPLVWAIINREDVAGVSLLYLSKGIDNGKIIAQASFKIGENAYISDVSRKAKKCGIELIQNNYYDILSGKVVCNEQDHKKASYGAQRNPEDGKIKWSKNNKRLYDEIRAQSHPYPGAFTFNERGKKIYIWKARIFENDYFGIPGKVVAHTENKEAIVTCGKGALYLSKVQIESNSERPASEELRVGEKLK